MDHVGALQLVPDEPTNEQDQENARKRRIFELRPLRFGDVIVYSPEARTLDVMRRTKSFSKERVELKGKLDPDDLIGILAALGVDLMYMPRESTHCLFFEVCRKQWVNTR